MKCFAPNHEIKYLQNVFFFNREIKYPRNLIPLMYTETDRTIMI